MNPALPPLTDAQVARVAMLLSQVVSAPEPVAPTRAEAVIDVDE